MKSLDLGNKEFKTKRGAANWMARRGYDLNGNSLAAH
jgi:hypothetical protein